jgi:DNA-directed RNA polymerase specialized sigma24 family protein
MATPSASRLPQDDDGLAQVAADSSRPDGLRHQAFELLIPTILLVARRVCVRFAGHWRNDVLTDAPGDIWTSIGQFPQGGRFEPWCYTVLRNRWLDIVGREGRRRPLADRAAAALPSDPDLHLAIERALDASEPFDAGDLRLIGGWPLRDRLVLLCLADLWQKIPPPEWRRWVIEHRSRFGFPDGKEFPPEALAGCDQIADRNAVLSAALNIKRNTLSVLLYHGKARLLELRYVRDHLNLSGEAPP